MFLDLLQSRCDGTIRWHLDGHVEDASIGGLAGDAVIFEQLIHKAKGSGVPKTLTTTVSEQCLCQVVFQSAHQGVDLVPFSIKVPIAQGFQVLLYFCDVESLVLESQLRSAL